MHVHAEAAAAAGEDKEAVLDDEAIDDEEEAEAADEAALADVVDGGDEIKAADVDEDEIDAEVAEELGKPCGCFCCFLRICSRAIVTVDIHW